MWVNFVVPVVPKAPMKTNYVIWAYDKTVVKEKSAVNIPGHVLARNPNMPVARIWLKIVSDDHVTESCATYHISGVYVLWHSCVLAKKNQLKSLLKTLKK